MSEPEKDEEEEISVGRLTGKTTIHTVTILITNPDVERNNYFVIYGDQDDDGEREAYMLSIIDMWSDSKGLMAKLQVLGERPQRPFEMGAEVYLATEEQITKILGISNPPNLSVSVGKLMGYPFSVNLLVKNFGRIFITGKSGSGKSYTMGVLCEEFLKKGIPVVIIDRHGEYGSLKVASEDLEGEGGEEEIIAIYCPWCGKEVEQDATECKACGKSLELEMSEVPTSEEFQPISEEEKPKGSAESEYVDNIIEFADLKMNQGGDIDIEYLFSLDPADLVAPNLCTIVNFRGMSLEVQEIIAGKLLKKLFQASTSRQIPPFYLFLDEAHLFAGKKQTETCETVKLFAQEGRKFGANIVIGTQRPQLLDTTIRAQAGSWVVHNLSDVRDIGITISSAEDLSNENKSDISGLDKGQAIICGEAVAGIPLFVKIRKRRTKHGGTGFNALDFLSDNTVEELKKRRERILGGKSEEELEGGKAVLQDIVEQKSPADHLEDIKKLKIKNAELEIALEKCKQQQGGTSGTSSDLGITDANAKQKIKELETEVNVWKEKYNFVKARADSGAPSTPVVSQPVEISSPSEGDPEKIGELSNKILELENEVEKWKTLYEKMKTLSEASIEQAKISESNLEQCKRRLGGR